MWCEVVAGSAKRRSASRTASANQAPPGTTSSGWRSPSAPSVVHSARSASSPAPRPSPPPTLTTVSTGAPPGARRAPRRAPSRRRSRSMAPSATARPRRAATSRPRKAPEPTRTTGASGGEGALRPGAPPPRAGAAARRGGTPRSHRSPSASSCSTSEHTSRAMRSRANSTRGGAPVGRRAVVGVRRQVAEDEMDVGADREVLRRHRAPPAGDGHARRDRREVRAQHAGVDELAGQQPLAGRCARSRRRGHRRSGRCRRSCCRRR